jgi:signal transduction histidine kinase
MKWEAISPNSLRWTFRLIEWVTLIMGAIVTLLEERSLFFTNPILVGCYLLLFVLSFEFPSHRPRSQQRLYLATQMAVTMVANWMNGGFEQYSFLVLIKACILLHRREVIIWAIITGILYVSGMSWWFFFGDLSEVSSNYTVTLKDRWRTFLAFLTSYVGLTAYVLLIGFFLAAERRSRKRAEALSLEIQELAAQVERSRIAREIHDSLGHTLVALGIQLEVAQKLQQDCPRSVQYAVKMAKQLADDSLEDVRRSLHSLRNPNLDFRQSIEQFIQQLFVPPLDIDLRIDLPSLPATLGNQLYFILKEGLMNIQKHAQATKIWLFAHMTEDEIIIKLEDNGCGFDLGLSQTGLGIQGMGERTQLIGGELTFASTIGEGTSLQVRVPR